MRSRSSVAIRRSAHQFEETIRQLGALGGRGDQRAHRPAGQGMNLQRTLNALRIVGVDPSRRLRVQALQSRVHRGPADDGGLVGQGLAEQRIRARQSGQALLQRLEIEHGAADQERDPALRADLRHRREGIITKARRRVGLGGIQDIDQAMRRTGQHIGGRLGRSDVHAAIDHRRIDTDDLARQTLHQLDSQIRLAGRGRTHQQDGEGALPGHVARSRVQGAFG
jgi:hypothetical protein